MEKGEIWIVSLSDTSDHEQIGTRPAIFVSDTETSICVVIPITSNLQALRFGHTLSVSPTHSNGLSEESVALLFQIRALDKSRLKRKTGKLDSSVIKKLDEMLRALFNI